MAPPNTALPGEVKSTAQMPSPTLSPSVPSLVKRAENPLTTPYVFPPECAFNYAMTSSTSGISDDFGQAEETFLYLEMYKNEHFSSCQPTGAVEGYDKQNGRLKALSVYRGAVCPSGWMAFDVGLASHTPETSRKTLPPETWSTARCCKSGDTYGPNFWSIPFDQMHYGYHNHVSVCVSEYRPEGSVFASFVVNGKTSYPFSIYTNTITRDGSTSTTTGIYTPIEYTQLTLPFTKGRAFYAAMSMEWFEEDNKTLNPTWPTLTSDMLIPTWSPGSTSSNLNHDGVFDHRGRGPKAAPPPSVPSKVAIPVIAVLATLLALSLGALLLMLWRGGKVNRQGPGRRKIVDDHHLRVPPDGEAGSTAQLNEQVGDDMELREREVAR